MGAKSGAVGKTAAAAGAPAAENAAAGVASERTGAAENGGKTGDLLALSMALKEARFAMRQAHSDALLVCLGLNLPLEYAQRHGSAARRLFAYAAELLRSTFATERCEIATDLLFGVFVLKPRANACAADVKAHCIQLENSALFMRLIDLDVYDRGRTVSTRTQQRRCFLCERSATFCRRQAAHSYAQICAQIDALMDDFLLFFAQQFPCRSAYAAAAEEALLIELCAAPKLGLVEPNNPNAHADMTHRTFIASACVLRGFFEAFFTLGALAAADAGDESPGSEREFARTKRLGVRAERAMFERTGGANTHKGALFLFAVVLYCCGKCVGDGGVGGGGDGVGGVSAAELGRLVGELCAGLCERELAPTGGAESGDKSGKTGKTAGEIAFEKFGIKGVRAEVQNGLRCCLRGYEFYRSCGDFAELRTLFFLASIADDTVLLKRAGFDLAVFARVRRTCARLARRRSEGFEQAVRRLNRLYVARNLSFGGSADLLAVVVFLALIDA